MSKVLIVDDTPELRRRLVRFAKTCVGVETTEAATSQEAIRLIQKNGFDVVVTDLVMESHTEEDGRAVLREAERAGHDISVIAVTSFGSPESVAETMRLGAYDYIERGSPEVNLKEVLARRIADALSMAALRRLLAHLSISNEDLDRLLCLPAGTVVHWKTAIPPESEAVVKAADSALERMLAIFRSELLPDVVRRNVELFQGRSALDLILDGRIEEVADRYDRAFAYQG